MENQLVDLTDTVIAFVTTWGLQVIGAIVLLIVGRIVSSTIRRMTERALRKVKTDESLIPFVSSSVYYLALAVVIIAVLNLFGVETTSLIAVLGAAGLAVGLAVQGTLSNFASGVMLLIFRPFKSGDYIEAGGTAGSVKEINIFTTILATPDNVQIIVPNSQIYGGTIKNYSSNDTRRNDIVMGVSYDDDINLAIETIKGILNAESRVLGDPAPVVAVSELGDSSVNIAVRPWCKATDYWTLRFDLLKNLKEALEAAGCSIPYPQRDLHIVNGGCCEHEEEANS